MAESTRRGLYLLAGCVLTLIWIFLCPGYTVAGEMSSYRTYIGPGTWTHMEHVHLDIAAFIGGLTVIWSALGAVYCLRRSIIRFFTPAALAQEPQRVERPEWLDKPGAKD